MNSSPAITADGAIRDEATRTRILDVLTAQRTRIVSVTDALSTARAGIATATERLEWRAPSARMCGERVAELIQNLDRASMGSAEALGAVDRAITHVSSLAVAPAASEPDLVRVG